MSSLIHFYFQHLQRLPGEPGHDAWTSGLLLRNHLFTGKLRQPFDFQVTEVRDEQERIASLLVAVLVLGIGTGSFLSYPIVNCL